MIRRLSWSPLFELLAAFAAGLVVVWLFRLANMLAQSLLLRLDLGVDLMQLGPGIAVAAMMAVVVLVNRGGAVGWMITTAGVAALALSIQLAGGDDGGEGRALLLAAISGVILGGVMLAAVAARPAGRVAIGIGFTAGLLLAEPEADLAYELTGRFPIAGLQPNALHFGVLAIVVLAAALTVQDGAIAPATSPGAGIGLLAYSLVAAAVPFLVSLFGQLTGMLQPLAAGAALLITAGFLWYLYRLAGADSARWIGLSLALAAPLAATLTSRMFEESPTLPALAAGVAVVAGALLAVVVRPAIPWDAIGAFIAIVSLYLAMRSQPEEGFLGLKDAPSGFTLTLLCATGFALASGLSRLLRSTSDSAAGLVAGAAGAGLAVLLLVGQSLFIGIVLAEMPRLDPTVFPVFTVAAVSALGLLAMILPLVTPRGQRAALPQS